jgi:hypothetical protein
MQSLLKAICWLTLVGDSVLLTCAVLTGCFGNGYPYAEMRVGSFKVTSLMPGGAAFLSFIAVWTGILAVAVLCLMRGKDKRPAKPGAAPRGGLAKPVGHSEAPEGPPALR